MRTKFFVVTALASALSSFAFAQDYHLLHSDPQGDQGMAANTLDARSISFAVDSVQDSLWFKIVLWDSVMLDQDWGFKIGLDSDGDNANGSAWTGYQNNGMKYDYLIDFYNNKFFPPTVTNLLDGNNALVTDVVPFWLSDAFTLELRIPLSTVDDDAYMNLIAGWGSFDGFIYDDIPNSGTMSTNAVISSVGDATQLPDVTCSIAPNPTSGSLTLNVNAPAQQSRIAMQVFTSTGQLAAEQTVAPGQGSHNFGHLQPGIYLVQLVSSEWQLSQRLVVQ